MMLQWSLLLPGALLLLFPADRLLSSRVQLRSFDSFQSLENSPRYRPWWWVPVMWLDPLRAFAGSLLLLRACGVQIDDPRLAFEPGYWVMSGTLAVAVFSQTLTWKNGEALLAPVGFVAGVVLAMVPWAVALVVVALATLAMLGLRAFHAFFTIGTIAVLGLGLLTGEKFVRLAPVAVVLLIPIVVGIVSGRMLMIPGRDGSGRNGFTGTSG